MTFIVYPWGLFSILRAIISLWKKITVSADLPENSDAKQWDFGQNAPTGETRLNLENVETFRVPDLTPSEVQAVGEKILKTTELAEQEDSFEDLARQISETSTEAYEVLNATNPEARTEFMEYPEHKQIAYEARVDGF